MLIKGILRKQNGISFCRFSEKNSLFVSLHWTVYEETHEMQLSFVNDVLLFVIFALIFRMLRS